MKTVFYGGSNYVIPIIEILKQNFGLSLVVVKNENDPLINYCKLNNIQVEVNGYLKYIMEEENEQPSITLHKAEVGVVADFGTIIPKDLIDFYPKGIINVHPSMLPKFRGPTPVQTALLEGEKTTGVSIIKIDESVDHGPILIQKEYDISDTDTSVDLLKKLFAQGAVLLNEALREYIEGHLEPKEQDHSKATFTRIFTKSDGFIDIASFPEPKKLEQMIKAFYPWPGVWTKTNINGQNEKIVKFLPNKMIQVEGKKEMSYKDFLNGYPNLNSHLKLFIEQHAKN